MALFQYEWEGPQHASTSRMLINGELAARNLITNPSFELGTEGVTTSGNILESRTTVTERVIAGDWAFWPRAQQNMTHAAYAYQYIDNLQGGDWLAFKAAVRATTGSAREARLRIRFLGGPDNVYEWITPTTNVQHVMHWLQGTAQVPNGYDSAWAMMYFYSENEAYLSEGARFSTDGWIAASGGTEQQALSQVSNYFDGSYLDYYDQAMAKVWTGSSWAELRPKFYA